MLWPALALCVTSALLTPYFTLYSALTTNNPLVRSLEGLINDLDQFDPLLISQVALEAMFVFEEARGIKGTAGYAVPVANRQDVERLKQALMQVVDRSECCPSEVIGALSAVHDPALGPLFRRCLSCQIAAQNAGGMYAAMMALDALGENVFGGRQSRSILDWERNRDLATVYLQRFPGGAQ
jgi:hypothetical protein